MRSSFSSSPEKTYMTSDQGIFVSVRRLAVPLALSMLVALTSVRGQPARADDAGYPSKPLKLVVPLAAGGPTDILARIVAQPLAETLGQPVIVDNRPGAGGNIGAELVAKSPADGYTLFMGTSGPLSINSSLFEKLGFDPLRDFAPIAMVASAPFVVAVHPAIPANSLEDLIALAKQKPGKLNYGAVPGSASHLATELFKSMAGVDIVHIPYKGAAPANNDLVAGQIDVSFASTPGVLPHVRSGRLKALAASGRKRLAQLPEVPTIAESGLTGYEASVWYGVVAPAHTPRDIVVRLNGEIRKIVERPATRERMVAADFDPAVSTPEQFESFIRSETAKWRKVVSISGAKAD
jgi:tripartite-type tricarboxylate transporter receptor subunit TctC